MTLRNGIDVALLPFISEPRIFISEPRIFALPGGADLQSSFQTMSSPMGVFSEKIDALMNEANDCDLIGSLATNPETRRINQERAVELREQAQKARKLEQASFDAATSKTNLSNCR